MNTFPYFSCAPIANFRPTACVGYISTPRLPYQRPAESKDLRWTIRNGHADLEMFLDPINRLQTHLSVNLQWSHPFTNVAPPHHARPFHREIETFQSEKCPEIRTKCEMCWYPRAVSIVKKKKKRRTAERMDLRVWGPIPGTGI